MKSNLFLAVFLLVLMGSKSFAFRPYEPVKPTSIHTDALGRSGFLLLKDWPAPLLNPAWLPTKDCPAEENLAENNQSNLDKKLCDDVETPRFNIRLPVLEASEKTTQLLGISSNEQRIQFLLDHLGQPLSLGASTDIGVRINENTTLVGFQQFRIRALVFHDLNAFGQETIDASVVEVSGFGVVQPIVATDSIVVGINLNWLRVRSKNLKAPLLDVAAVKQLKNINNLNVGTGLAANASLVYRPNPKGYALGLITQNIGTTSFKLKDKQRPVDRFSQDITLAWELPFEQVGMDGAISIALNDILSDYETNKLKKIHAGIWLNVGFGLTVLTGINQGNLSYGLGWNSRLWSLYAASIREEIGDKIGFRSDQQYLIGLRVSAW